LSLLVSAKRLPPADLDFVSRKVKSLANLDGFKNESILLTGGTGFFGKWLSQSLAKLNDDFSLGNRVTLVSRDAEKSRGEQPWLAARSDFEFVQSDIRQFQSKDQFTTIIHGAASASQSLNENRPEEMLSVITGGSQRILEIAKSAQARRVQFISSGAVYGAQPSDLDFVSEDDFPLGERSHVHGAYGEAKRMAELAMSQAARGLGFRLSIPRCFAFVGPHLPLDSHFAVGNFIASVLQGRPIQINGDGTPLRSYLYAADLSIWLLVQLIEVKGIEICNVGSDTAVSIAQLANTVHKVGCELIPERLLLDRPVRIAGTPQPGKLPARYVPSVTRARTTFNLEEWNDLEESIRKTINWHLTAKV
jgi:nucleoside-diphosphate-sugar epimerase